MGKQKQSPLPLGEAVAVESLTLRSSEGPVDRTADFKIFTRGMEIEKAASGDAGEQVRVKCIASSSIEDRHGDTITEECIRGMAKQAVGLTIFRNHRYSIPDDVFGFVEKARVKKMTAGDAKDKGLLPEHIKTSGSETYAFLELDVVVDQSNEKATQTIASLENGITLGVSIGAMILDYDEKEGYEDSWFPPLIINEVELLEASVVGIPANPLSWVEGATKAVAVNKGLIGDRATREDLYRAISRKSAEEAEETKSEEAETEEAETEDEEATKAVETNDRFASPAEIVEYYRVLARDEDSDIELNEKELRILLGDDLEAYLNTRPDDEQVDKLLAAVMEDRPLEADAEPDATADSAEAEPGEADDPDAQDATKDGSNPDPAEGNDSEATQKAEDEIQRLTEEGILESVKGAADVLRQTLEKLIATQERVIALEAENGKLRDQLEVANSDVEKAVTFVNKMLDLPLGRKSQVREETKRFAQNLQSTYGEEVLGIIYGKGSST